MYIAGETLTEWEAIRIPNDSVDDTESEAVAQAILFLCSNYLFAVLEKEKKIGKAHDYYTYIAREGEGRRRGPHPPSRSRAKKQHHSKTSPNSPSNDPRAHSPWVSHIPNKRSIRAGMAR